MGRRQCISFSDGSRTKCIRAMRRSTPHLGASWGLGWAGILGDAPRAYLGWLGWAWPPGRLHYAPSGERRWQLWARSLRVGGQQRECLTRVLPHRAEVPFVERRDPVALEVCREREQRGVGEPHLH